MFQLIRKEYGEGIVCAVGGGQILVAPLYADDNGESGKSAPPKKGCGTQEICGGCGGCLSANPVSGGYIGRFHVGVSDVNNYAPGDRVRFCRFIPEPNLTAALIFGVPISFTLTAMLFWIAKAPDQIESALAIFTVIAALLAGIFIAGLFDRLFKASYPAKIIDIYGDINNDNGADKGGRSYENRSEDRR